jgi:transposase
MQDKDAIIAEQARVICELKEEIKRLREEIAGLKQNSSNSSRPPSSDGPEVVKSKRTNKRRKKRGAKKGHKANMRKLFPKEEVTRFIDMVPDACTCGCSELEKTDQPPMRHQMVEIPPIKPDVTEYVQHIYRCKNCGEHIYKPLADDVKRNVFGPGVLSMVGILTGVINTSKRKALAFMNEALNIPMSLGGLTNCEAKISEALADTYDEVCGHLQSQEVAHADETGWSRGNNQKGWLWTLCCGTAAVFMIHASRGQAAARKLIDAFAGTLVTDRWGGYNFFGFARQICWAHLKRDFKAVSEAGGKLGKIGIELRWLTRKILRMRCCVRDGTLQWKTFQNRMPQLQEKVEKLLGDASREKGKLAGKCKKILSQKQWLWTFVRDVKVPPTNNLAERNVRPGVLWRKVSFGTQSERGARYVERVLTAGATCKMQCRSIIEYLRDACHAHQNGMPAPAIIQNNSKTA